MFLSELQCRNLASVLLIPSGKFSLISKSVFLFLSYNHKLLGFCDCTEHQNLEALQVVHICDYLKASMFNGNKHPRNSSDWEQELKLKDLPRILFIYLFLLLLSAISFSTAVLVATFYFSVMCRILWEIPIEPFLPFISSISSTDV